MPKYPNRPPRLRHVFQKYDPPLYFVTVCLRRRGNMLANTDVHQRLISFGESLVNYGSSFGRYVIMPDHIHLFVRIGSNHKLGATVGFFKQSLSVVLNRRGNDAPHWQQGFFDHLIRNEDSYSEKWDYVYLNPVRVGLVEIPSEWPYQGEVVPISY